MTEQRTVTAVLAILGALAISTLIGGIYLTAIDKALPGELIAIGSAAAGGVASLLSKTSTGPQAVHVVNPELDPVPVELPPDDGRADLVTVLVVVVLVLALLWFLGIQVRVN